MPIDLPHRAAWALRLALAVLAVVLPATALPALDLAVRSGKIQRGQLLLLEAFGGGFTWGSALIRF